MPKKVAFVHFYTFRMLRGIENLVISLANRLARKDFEVSILSASKTLEPLVSPEPEVNVFTFRGFRYWEYSTIAPQYATNLIHNKYDYIILFFADFGETAALKLAEPFIKNCSELIVYLCYPYSSVPHRYQSMDKAGFFSKAKHVIADADFVAQDALGFVQREIGIVPVGTDYKVFHRDMRSRQTIREMYSFNDEHIVLLNVSALEPRKGPRRVISMLPKLLEKHPNARYLILGKGEDEPFLRKQSKEMGLEHIVTFAGTTTNLAAYYSACDIFVMLPDNEANSIASHEALACELPVVASNTGGFPEVMKPQFSILVSPENETDIVESLSSLIGNPDLRQEMGRSGRIHVIENLSWDHSALKLQNYLE